VINQSVIDALLALQLFVVFFIGLHDWIPLGPLNDVKAVRTAVSAGKLFISTVLSTLPFAIGFAASVYYARTGFPHWLLWLLWISYGLAIYGMLRTWWIPYLLIDEPARADRYQAMFGRTHTFLPVRNGIRPDTLHIALHIVPLAVIILLAVISFGP
jgi:hypothetical protein